MVASTRKLQLMTTEGCHLCEQALELFNRSRLKRHFNLELVDIIDDPILLARYQTSIPVLVSVDGNKTLKWPFSIVELDVFLNSL